VSDIPKLYRAVKIEFWSLRCSLSLNLGVTEHDIEVERIARRVPFGDSWKWVICTNGKQGLWDWALNTDQEVLDNIGDDISLVKVCK